MSDERREMSDLRGPSSPVTHHDRAAQAIGSHMWIKARRRAQQPTQRFVRSADAGPVTSPHRLSHRLVQRVHPLPEIVRGQRQVGDTGEAARPRPSRSCRARALLVAIVATRTCGMPSGRTTYCVCTATKPSVVGNDADRAGERSCRAVTRLERVRDCLQVSRESRPAWTGRRATNEAQAEIGSARRNEHAAQLVGRVEQWNGDRHRVRDAIEPRRRISRRVERVGQLIRQVRARVELTTQARLGERLRDDKRAVSCRWESRRGNSFRTLDASLNSSGKRSIHDSAIGPARGDVMAVTRPVWPLTMATPACCT